MTVYVDNMLMQARVGRINARWSHLMADTHDELVAFAVSIGLNPRWIQYPGTWKEHFDVTHLKRAQALAAGATAIEIMSDESKALMDRKRAADPVLQARLAKLAADRAAKAVEADAVARENGHGW